MYNTVSPLPFPAHQIRWCSKYHEAHEVFSQPHSDPGALEYVRLVFTAASNCDSYCNVSCPYYMSTGFRHIMIWDIWTLVLVEQEGSYKNTTGSGGKYRKRNWAIWGARQKVCFACNSFASPTIQKSSIMTLCTAIMIRCDTERTRNKSLCSMFVNQYCTQLQLCREQGLELCSNHWSLF